MMRKSRTRMLLVLLMVAAQAVAPALFASAAAAMANCPTHIGFLAYERQALPHAPAAEADYAHHDVGIDTPVPQSDDRFAPQSMGLFCCAMHTVAIITSLPSTAPAGPIAKLDPVRSGILAGVSISGTDPPPRIRL
jgi:hypothetical protein